MLATAGYGNNDGIITMTTDAGSVNLGLRGTGSVTVDWGDGSEKQTLEFDLINAYAGWTSVRGELPSVKPKPVTGWAVIRRDNMDTNPRTITITGNNITGLHCLIGSMKRCNQFTKLDVSRNTALTELYCDGNLLTELDVSLNTGLTELDCSNNQLTELDVSRNTALTLLNCSNNQLTELNVSKNTDLVRLSLMGNKLTELDISRNTALESLFCPVNKLTELDVSKNTVMRELVCFANQFTELDVSKNITLSIFSCSNNQLTKLDVSKNPVLTKLNCDNNKLNADALNVLFGMLTGKIITVETVLDKYKGTERGGEELPKIINFDSNPGYTDCDQSILKAKGWILEAIYYQQFEN